MNDHPIKHTLDYLAWVVTAGTFMNILPALAGLASLVWTVLRIVEMFTGKTIAELLKRNK